MNIFILDTNKKKAAQYHMDRHIIKMPVEAAQMISTIIRYYLGEDIPDYLYKSTHESHPCTLWTGKTIENFTWLCEFGLELVKEYRWRYKSLKHERSEAICQYGLSLPQFLPSLKLTSFALAMPDKYKSNDPVDSYRNYYIGEKQHLAKWKRRGKPEWFFFNEKDYIKV